MSISLFQLDLQSFSQWWGEGISVIPVGALGSIPLLPRGSLPSLRWTPVHWSLPCLRPRGDPPCSSEALSRGSPLLSGPHMGNSSCLGFLDYQLYPLSLGRILLSFEGLLSGLWPGNSLPKVSWKYHTAHFVTPSQGSLSCIANAWKGFVVMFSVQVEDIFIGYYIS